MTGDEAATPDEIEVLAARRREWYAALGGVDPVPSPRLPLTPDATVPPRSGMLVGAVGYGAGLVYLAFLADARDHWVSGPAFLGFALGLLAAPLVAWRARRGIGQVRMWPCLARPWLDVLDGLRWGSVEPGNPASGVALAHVARVRELLGREVRRWDQRVTPSDDVLEEVHASASLVWATAEAWRVHQSGLAPGAGVSPLDRLPMLTGPTMTEASVASDTSADAATSALGAGEYDLDFTAYSRRRRGMYERARGDEVTVPDPREPLLVRVSGLQRRRRQIATGLVVCLAASGASVALADAGRLGLSVLAAAPVAVLWWRGRRLSWTDVWPRRVRLTAGPAMAWRDYLDAVAYVDSGQAAVPTVEAIRGAERRVRALALEISSPGLSDTERPVLLAELHHLCSDAWTLVGQERAEARLLDELDDMHDG